MTKSLPPQVHIIIRFLLLAVFSALAAFVFWKWSYDNGINEAKKEFETASFAIEKKVLNELGLFVSSKVNYFIDTQRFSFDSKRGLTRHFPPGEIEIFIYFPKEQWEQNLKGGKGKLENSPEYQTTKNHIIQYFDEKFTDPWLSKSHPSRLKPLYIIKAAQENRSRGQFLKAFEGYEKKP